MRALQALVGQDVPMTFMLSQQSPSDMQPVASDCPVYIISGTDIGPAWGLQRWHFGWLGVVGMA